MDPKAKKFIADIEEERLTLCAISYLPAEKVAFIDIAFQLLDGSQIKRNYVKKRARALLLEIYRESIELFFLCGIGTNLTDQGAISGTSTFLEDLFRWWEKATHPPILTTYCQKFSLKIKRLDDRFEIYRSVPIEQLCELEHCRNVLSKLYPSSDVSSLSKLSREELLTRLDLSSSQLTSSSEPILDRKIDIGSGVSRTQDKLKRKRARDTNTQSPTSPQVDKTARSISSNGSTGTRPPDKPQFPEDEADQAGMAFVQQTTPPPGLERQEWNHDEKFGYDPAATGGSSSRIFDNDSSTNIFAFNGTYSDPTKAGNASPTEVERFDLAMDESLNQFRMFHGQTRSNFPGFDQGFIDPRMNAVWEPNLQ